jgi:Zn-dependent peptidase ImmA (M78 family)/DNA-binding XRE family transcriptional regulator
MIYGSRIEQARKISGFTQKQLSEQIGVNQSAIAQFEKDITIPSDETLKAISLSTGFLISFFQQFPAVDFSQGSLTYRAQRSITSKDEERAYGYAKLIFEHVKNMASRIILPNMNLPRLKGKPEMAAQLLRASFNLSPNMPIANVINIAEKNGVIVLSLPLFIQRLDAFSMWGEVKGEARPIVVITSGKPGDRLRFSVVHELGHLIMHTPVKDIKEMEQEANDFASEFLMPKNVMASEFMKPVSLYSIAKLKVRWGVSMQALIVRAKNLKIVTDRQASYLFSQMSARGWRNKEPSNLDVVIETPQLVRKMIEKLYGDNLDKYAQEMNLRTDRATELTLYS